MRCYGGQYEAPPQKPKHFDFDLGHSAVGWRVSHGLQGSPKPVKYWILVAQPERPRRTKSNCIFLIGIRYPAIEAGSL
jgi:hypothetical protein